MRVVVLLVMTPCRLITGVLKTYIATIFKVKKVKFSRYRPKQALGDPEG
jgi:hypothetical protein